MVTSVPDTLMPLWHERERRPSLTDHHPEEECIMITHAQATEKILAAKQAKGLTFAATLIGSRAL